MRTLLDFMDYAYYRYAKFYDKHDRLEKGELEKSGYSYTALLIVSVPIGLMIMFLGILVHDKILGNTNGYTTSKMVVTILLIIQFGILVLNYFRYRHRFEQLENRWGNHSKRKRYLGALLAIFYFIFPFIFFIIAMKFLPVM